MYCDLGWLYYIWKKSEDKSVQLVRVAFFRSDFLQNPYFSVQNFFLFITRKIAYWNWNWKSVQKSMNEHWLRFLDQCFQGNLSLEKKGTAWNSMEKLHIQFNIISWNRVLSPHN